MLLKCVFWWRWEEKNLIALPSKVVFHFQIELRRIKINRLGCVGHTTGCSEIM